MSVLANLSISYESLQGEPSFFATNHQPNVEKLETPQQVFSLPNYAQKTTHRTSISNFEFAPSIATRRVVSRSVSQAPKPAVTAVSSANFIDSVPTPTKDIFKQIEHSTKEVARTSRGMFNDFERASLLSYMQRRQYS